jgi:hypothetical protein
MKFTPAEIIRAYHVSTLVVACSVHVELNTLLTMSAPAVDMGQSEFLRWRTFEDQLASIKLACSHSGFNNNARTMHQSTDQTYT